MGINIIEDGHGTGNKAKVDDHGRLYVVNNNVSHMAHHSSYHKNAFAATFSCTLQDTNATSIAFLQNNTTDKDLEIYWVGISADANIEIASYINDTYSSGGISVTDTNLNAGSTNTSATLLYEGGASGNLALTTTDRKQLSAAFIGAYNTHQENLDGAVILPPGKSFTVTATGAASDKVLIHMGYAFHTAGTKL